MPDLFQSGDDVWKGLMGLSEEAIINVGVIGVGHLGQHHARIYASLPHVALKCVVDSDQTRGQKIAATYGCDYFSDYRSIPYALDAISVVVPTVAHFEVASYFLEKKIHVLVEKPVTQTLEEAARLQEICKGKELIFQVGHIERFNPVWKDVLPKINNPRFMEVHRLAPFKGRSTDISVVLDLMIHDLDIILNLVNSPVKNIACNGVPVIGSLADIVNARLEFENGCVANVTASRISQKEMRKIRIFQPRSYVQLDYQNREGEMITLDNGQFLRTEIKGSGEEPLKIELEHFLYCIRHRQEPRVTLHHGQLALETALTIQSKVNASLDMR